MKTADATILILPGTGGGQPEDWFTRWQDRLKTARRVPLDDWQQPDRATYSSAIAEAVTDADKPVILVAHAVGVLAVAHAARDFPAGKVKGAFLAAVPDVEGQTGVAVAESFLPVPRDPLPFPSLLLASRNDPHCAFEVAEDLAGAWGARLVDLRESGHVNAESGHGPWPEGLMTFGKFLQGLPVD